MSCDEYKSLIWEYESGELDCEKRREFEAHISVCADCRNELSEIRLMKKGLEELKAPELPADFTEKLMAAVKEEEAKKGARQKRTRIFRMAGTLAAVFVVGLFGVLAAGRGFDLGRIGPDGANGGDGGSDAGGYSYSVTQAAPKEATEAVSDEADEAEVESLTAEDGAEADTAAAGEAAETREEAGGEEAPEITANDFVSASEAESETDSAYGGAGVGASLKRAITEEATEAEYAADEAVDGDLSESSGGSGEVESHEERNAKITRLITQQLGFKNFTVLSIENEASGESLVNIRVYDSEYAWEDTEPRELLYRYSDESGFILLN